MKGRRSGAILAALLACHALPAPGRAGDRPKTIAAKSNTEGYILGEIVAQLIESRGGGPVSRKLGMGGTQLVFKALEVGEIDLYPEYTGTVETVITGRRFDRPEAMREHLRNRYAIAMSAPLGFSNSYTVVMSSDKARRLGISRISDLARHPELSWGVTHEFLSRDDGLAALSRHYGLARVNAVGMEKSLAYRAIAQGAIDLTDAYSTDGRLLQGRLTILEDDRRFFPEYAAVLLIRNDALAKHPELGRAVARLEGSIDQRRMQELNAMVDVDGASPAQAAGRFLRDDLGIEAAAPPASDDLRGIARSLLQHVKLSAVSLLLSACVGVSLGLLIYWFRPLAGPVLNAVGVLQTIPGIGLLALMIPFFGLGATPAIVALSLYGLLPIVQNTFTGIDGIPAPLVDAARGVGLSRWQTLRLVQLPLALRYVIAGIKTSAVITVGMATLAALVGAGGLGDFILTGLSLSDLRVMLKGIVPAALLAVGVDKLFGALERASIPRGLAAG